MALTLKKVKGTLDRVLDKNLQDLVRGIRAHKNNEAKYISECLEEIKLELRQENASVKANAIAKLTYLQMLGYDISWAAFNIIEVMSSPKFTYKRVAYLAASQCFHKDLDVLMLSTNLLRKDLNSHNAHDCGLAITSLACFITPDLARDLGNDVVTLMNSTKPYIRKKAVLLMYKVFLNHPDALRSAFPRLREKLEDPDPGVQSAAVHVICELARRNPQNYLPLAPTFFKLMTSSVNNWVLIKIIKLFGALTPIEPRLGKKLLEPLTNLIHSTSAMSLLYECIQTVIAVLLAMTSKSEEGALPEHASAIQLCVQKLRVLIEDADQNLKYLGLLAMSKVLEAHPKPVQAHKDLILACLDDRDESIRLRALDLLHGMVSRKNLVEITRKLIAHAEKAEGSHYRDEIVAKVIDICSQSNYQYVTNFEWYLSVLIELARLQGMKRGHEIASQMLDVAVRVAAVRPYAVQQMAVILLNSQMFYTQGALQPSGSCEVLYAAAWICGEFSAYLPQPEETIDALLLSRAVQLPPHIQAVYLQNAAKIYGRLLRQQAEQNETLEDELEKEENGEDGAGSYVSQLNDRVRKALTANFIQSADLEVQERASCFLALADFVDASSQNGNDRQLTVISDLVALFEGELNPVAPKAQRKVPVPEGLDLEKWINDPPPKEVSPVSSEGGDIGAFGLRKSSPAETRNGSATSTPTVQLSPAELKRRREQRLAEQESNPHYLKSSTAKKTGKGETSLPKVQQLKGMSQSLIVSNEPETSEGSLLRSSGGGGGFGGGSMLDNYQQNDMSFSPTPRSGKKMKKTKRGGKLKGESPSKDEEDDAGESMRGNVVVSTAFDMPEGASFSDNESKEPHRTKTAKVASPDDDMHRALAEIHIDNPSQVTQPARPLPTSISLQVMKSKEPEPEISGGKKKKKKIAEPKKKGGKKTKKSAARQAEEGATVVEQEAPNKEATKASPSDDLDFWLVPSSDAPSAPAPPVEPPADTTAKVSPRRSAKKASGTKAGSKKQTSKDKDTAASGTTAVRDELASVLGTPCPAPDRSEYEEAGSGSATPKVAESASNDQLSPPAFAMPSGFSLLVENSVIRMGYQARPVESDNMHIAVNVCLQNLSSSLQVKEFELTILDAPGGLLSLLRSKNQPDGVIRLPSALISGQQGSGSFTLVIGESAFSSGSLPRLRGNLMYMTKGNDGIARQDQLEFRFTLPISACIHPEPYSTADSLQQLMTSGLLSERESANAAAKNGIKLDKIAASVANEMHLTVIERPGSNLSTATSIALHGRTLNGDHLCVLLKQQQSAAVNGGSGSGKKNSVGATNITIDVRASQAAKVFLSTFVKELTETIVNCC